MNSDAEIEAFVTAFEDCSLPRAEWTHVGHLVVALWYLRRCPRGLATSHIRRGIQRYNSSLGNSTGYHETVTLAWVEVIDRFLRDRGRSRPVHELARELIETVGESNQLRRYYSPEVIASELARNEWVPPDLLDFG